VTLQVMVAIIGVAEAPLVAQTPSRPTIVPAFTPREAVPAFVVECHNNTPSAVPFPTIRNIRLDGIPRQRTGGIAASLLGAPDERFVPILHSDADPQREEPCTVSTGADGCGAGI
jgi:hypothetical protein